MKKLISITLAASMLALPAAAASQAALSASGPALTAQSAILMERETGAVLLEKSPHEQLEPASVTKIMTMLLVMEALDSGRLAQDEIITVSARAAGMGGSQVYLKQGEQMTAWQLLKCVAVASGNDAAVALAEHLTGSEAAFVDQMNQRATELGMTGTWFLNCTGLPAAGHVTTAYDIALMSRALLQNHPKIHELTTTWMDSIRDGTFGLTNTNRLVRFYPGSTGLKTGSTDSALYCISATAQRDGMELIAVVLKAPTSNDRFEDAKALLDYGFSNYALASVYPTAPLSPVDVVLGTNNQVQPRLAHECRLLVPKGSQSSLTSRVTLTPNVEAPVEQGQILGQMEVYSGDQLLSTIPIVATESVPRLTVPGIFSRMLQRLLMAGS